MEVCGGCNGKPPVSGYAEVPQECEVPMLIDIGGPDLTTVCDHSGSRDQVGTEGVGSTGKTEGLARGIRRPRVSPFGVLWTGCLCEGCDDNRCTAPAKPEQERTSRKPEQMSPVQRARALGEDTWRASKKNYDALSVLSGVRTPMGPTLSISEKSYLRKEDRFFENRQAFERLVTERESVDRKVAALNRQYATARFFHQSGHHIQDLQMELLQEKDRAKRLNVRVDYALKHGTVPPEG